MNAALSSMAKSNIERNRLIFRSWHRGTQESDFLLGSFADSCLAGLDNYQLQRFAALLDCSDPDLFEWILGGGVPPAQHDHDVLQLLRAYWAQSPNITRGE
jgi:antitoxin CptB